MMSYNLCVFIGIVTATFQAGVPVVGREIADGSAAALAPKHCSHVGLGNVLYSTWLLERV
jgi:hypothetical protein